MYMCARWDVQHANCNVPEESSNIVSSDGSAGFASPAQLEALGRSSSGSQHHSGSGASGASRGGHHPQQAHSHQQHGHRNSSSSSNSGLPGSSSSSSSALSRSRSGGKEVCEWVACDKCSKWRKLPPKIDPNTLPEKVRLENTRVACL